MPFIGFEMAHVVGRVPGTTDVVVFQQLHGGHDVATRVGNEIGCYAGTYGSPNYTLLPHSAHGHGEQHCIVLRVS